METRVSVFVGPKRERDCGEVVHERDGIAVFCEVDGSEIELASVAGFDADVGQLLGDVDGELGFGLFATRGAMNPPKFPFLGAKGTEEEAFAAVAFDSEDA